MHSLKRRHLSCSALTSASHILEDWLHLPELWKNNSWLSYLANTLYSWKPELLREWFGCLSLISGISASSRSPQTYGDHSLQTNTEVLLLIKFQLLQGHPSLSYEFIVSKLVLIAHWQPADRWWVHECFYFGVSSGEARRGRSYRRVLRDISSSVMP